jgi:hypothetical protein
MNFVFFFQLVLSCIGFVLSFKKKTFQSLSSFGFFAHIRAVRSANPLANLHQFCSIVQLNSVKIDKVQFRVQILSSFVLAPEDRGIM